MWTLLTAIQWFRHRWIRAYSISQGKNVFSFEFFFLARKAEKNTKQNLLSSKFLVFWYVLFSSIFFSHCCSSFCAADATLLQSVPLQIQTRKKVFIVCWFYTKDISMACMEPIEPSSSHPICTIHTNKWQKMIFFTSLRIRIYIFFIYFALSARYAYSPRTNYSRDYANFDVVFIQKPHIILITVIPTFLLAPLAISLSLSSFITK